MILYGKSDVGMKRSVNQDNFYTEIYSDSVVFCVICDGMGGANGGSEASEIATEVFSAHMKEFIEKNLDADGKLNLSGLGKNTVASRLSAAADAANAAVYKEACEKPELSGMGTTLVAAVIADNILYSANIGDSRLYLISENSVRQVTHDHSYVQYLVDLGKLTPEEAKSSTVRSWIIRVIGTEDSVLTDTFTDILDGEGYVLLCSDGLTNHLTPEELMSVVTEKPEPHPSKSPEEESDEISESDEVRIKVERLVEKANEQGGTDNITAVLIKF